MTTDSVTAIEALKSASASQSVTLTPLWHLGQWYDVVIRWEPNGRTIATDENGACPMPCLVRNCRGCRRVIAMTSIVWRCPRCRREQRHTAQLARRWHRLAQRLRTVCMTCRELFRPRRGSACYCSQACRQRAYRLRLGQSQDKQGHVPQDYRGQAGQGITYIPVPCPCPRAALSLPTELGNRETAVGTFSYNRVTSDVSTSPSGKCS